jgi:hypothetical protein
VPECIACKQLHQEIIMSRKSNWIALAVLATFIIVALINSPTFGHCDGLDGPVVADARIALAARDAAPVLKWVPAKDEPEVRAAFDRTLAVRELGPQAMELADRSFFETVVRLHRAHEGAPFTGLVPSGTPVAQPIAHADAALEAGDVDELARAIAAAVEKKIRDQFAATLEARARKEESVEAGREYVDEYVRFVHFIKYLHEAAHGDHDYGHGG